MTTTTATTRTDIYETVTAQIVSALESCGGWKMPWHSTGAGIIPKNVKSGATYRGINTVILWAVAEDRGYTNSLWGTFKQWQELGAQVRKGEKSAGVVFWSKAEKKSENGEDEKGGTFLFAKHYNVFNVSQVDGYNPEEKEPLTEGRLENADQFFSRLDVKMVEGSEAFYQTQEDAVYMPPFHSFYSGEGYYSTLSHEVTHWTGHKTRLDRDLKGRFGDNSYAMEELVAELGAAFLCAELQISNKPREEHSSYLQSWLKVLKNDKRAIFTAASKAQEALDWMRGKVSELSVAA